MNYNRYEFSRREEILFHMGLLLIGILVSYLFYRNILGAPIVFLLRKRIRSYVKEELIIRQKSDFLEQFKDLLFVLSTSFSAGRGMADALGEAVLSMKDIYGEDSRLVREIQHMHDRMKISKEREEDVLQDLAERTGLEDVMDFVIIFEICRDTGAALVSALNKAAGVIIEKMTIEEEIREIVRRKQSEGMILFLMPPVVILFLNLLAPDYLAPLYETISGRCLMTGVIAATVGIYGMIRRIIRVQV